MDRSIPHSASQRSVHHRRPPTGPAPGSSLAGCFAVSGLTAVLESFPHRRTMDKYIGMDLEAQFHLRAVNTKHFDVQAFTGR